MSLPFDEYVEAQERVKGYDQQALQAAEAGDAAAMSPPANSATTRPKNATNWLAPSACTNAAPVASDDWPRQCRAWVAAYERAWRTAGIEGLEGLFTESASYRMSPYEEPSVGLERIGELWERERQGHDEEFEITYEIVAVEADTAVVRAEVHYGPPDRNQYRDLWIARAFIT